MVLIGIIIVTSDILLISGLTSLHLALTLAARSLSQGHHYYHDIIGFDCSREGIYVNKAGSCLPENG